MKYTRSCLIILLFHSTVFVFSQTAIDSVLLLRNSAFTDFRLMEENPGELTRNKLADLNSKAKNVIEIDNTIINYYLYKELEKNRSLEEKADKLILEIALLKKESELQTVVLAERRYLLNLLLFTIGVFGLLFLIALIFFIDRQIRYRSIKLELERMLPLREEINKDSQFQKDIMLLNKQIGELNIKNVSLISEINELKKKNIEKDETLNKEINSKKLFEEEIKKLIVQIKSQ
jgi:hypothetical protein